MRIAYDNLIDDYTLTPSSEDGSYPVENIQDTRLSRVFRTDSEVSDVTIDIDLGSAQGITCCAILAHNITSGATIKIQADDNAGFSSPAELSLTHAAGIIVHFFSSTPSYRYWRFYIDDDSNSDGYIELGRLFLGTYLTIDNSCLRELPEEALDTSVVDYSLTGQAYGDEGDIFRRYALQFPYWSSSMLSSIKTFVEAVKKYEPFILVIDEDNTDKILPCYCVKEEDSMYTHIFDYAWEGSMTFREVG